MNRISKAVTLVLVLFLMLTGCGASGKDPGEGEMLVFDDSLTAEATEEVTEAKSEEVEAVTEAEEAEPPRQYGFSGKSFTITLYHDKAPITCDNFTELVKSGFYDGLSFHRLVEGIIAQGGASEGNGSEKSIKGEFSANGVENDLSHTRGAVSMARATDPDSASTQFFICMSDKCTQFDGQYAAFGMVTEGMEVVDAFNDVKCEVNPYTNEVSVPVDPIIIDKAVMGEKDADGNDTVIITMK